jgi:hypothetical protein
MLEANEEEDKKSGKIDAVIAQIPTAIDINEPFDLNIIVVKDKNIPCRTLYKKSIEIKNWDYTEKINLMKDVTSIKSAGEWVLTEEEGVIEFTIPIPLNKTEFTQEDINLAMKELDYPQYKVQKVEIVSCNSLNYANDPSQLNLQKKRTEAMAKALAKKLGIASITNIIYQDGWDDFKKDVVEHHFHYDLILGTKEEAINQLKANQGKIAKELEEDYLQHHRYAKITLHVTYPIHGKLEYEFLLYKFDKAIKAKNMALAMSIQKYVIDRVEQGKYPIWVIDRMQIPEDKAYHAFLINKLYMQHWLSEGISDKIVEDVHKIFNLNNSNIAYFNLCVIKVNKTEFKTVSDITKLQTEIDKLYSMPQIPKEVVNNLNLELQFKIITFIKSRPSPQEFDALLTSTYEKIKTITNPGMLHWHNAYKLAYYFIRNNDYRYALTLMDPFIGDENVSMDFIFCYISVAATQESAFLSNLFTKAVNLAAEKASPRLCGLFNKLPIAIFDNKEVQKTVCKVCNR